ncbi:MAG: 2'-5' RNA ligase family protein [Candidatus Porifericomitaceae bacterium WSBS_2022_MAG_OTU9]
MKRLFFAASPPTDVARRLQAIEPTAGAACGRVVPAPKLHLTILFMVEVPLPLVDGLLALAGGLPVPQVSLCFDRVLFWYRAGVVVAATEQAPTALLAWRRELASGVEKMGVALEQRSWQPHITLRRNVSQKNADLRIATVDWHLSSFALFESNSGQYHMLGEWPAN